ncbi:MAG: FAD-binding oxidoreductase [Proteobacteria bacterium]|nr:FAD-binding oxidoreductase [Pseudomonadota bacterium]
MVLKRIYHPDASDPTIVADSWWEASARPMRHKPAPLTDSHTCDVAVIGGGYTGLNAAMHLAKAGARVCVAEAGHFGWGASGRNGGFCANTSTKKSFSEIITAYGIEGAHDIVRAQEEAIEQVRSFCDAAGIPSDTPDKNAELAVAHTPYQLEQLRIESDEVNQLLGLKTTVMDKQELTAFGAKSPAFYGGMILPWGFGLHPLNYLHALADSTIDAGATLSPETAIQSVTRQNGHYILTAKNSIITAKKIIIATNGYTAETIPSWSKGRILPAVSSILVTRPITQSEQAAQGWTTHHMSYDTRTLLHYFRLLPDGRMMFGGRGATSGDLTKQHAFFPELRRQFDEIFPAWAKIETDYQWSGFIGLNRKKALFLGPIDTDQTAWASLAYHGSGVAMASWGGKAIAQLLLGQKTLAQLPRLYTDPSHKFPFDFLRPQYLKLAYAYYRQTDKR